jgi:uncharacterized membrane protein YhhN
MSTWSTMTPTELIFRLVLIVLAVAVIGLFAWMWSRAGDGENVGCLGLILGLVAITLLIGGLAGPDAVRAFWG